MIAGRKNKIPGSLDVNETKIISARTRLWIGTSISFTPTRAINLWPLSNELEFFKDFTGSISFFSIIDDINNNT